MSLFIKCESCKNKVIIPNLNNYKFESKGLNNTSNKLKCSACGYINNVSYKNIEFAPTKYNLSIIISTTIFMLIIIVLYYFKLPSINDYKIYLFLFTIFGLTIMSILKMKQISIKNFNKIKYLNISYPPER